MALPIIIVIVALVSWALGILAMRQKRRVRAFDVASMSALQAQARDEARAQSGALADLPPWRTLQPRTDHPFLDPPVWERLTEWGDTIESGIEAKYAREEAALKLDGDQYRHQLDELKRLEYTRALSRYEANARLVQHICSVFQHEVDVKAGPTGEHTFGKQLAQDRLFVQLLKQRVSAEAKSQGWSSERLDAEIQNARSFWAPKASWTTSPARFISVVLKTRET